ncbi:hypothetical protein BCD67_07955 [Oscillatoriales cyanobacterium USR001]|nr:hypothetical protein BCD67_07955 [Oscillatoriales cyanobacterium USR001]
MKSTLCLDETPIHSNSIYAQDSVEACIAKAWFDLVAQEVDSYQADRWLYLCGDINDGEIYQDWFLWQDIEVSQNWEAYDPLSDFRLVAADRESLILQIDRIEAERKEMSLLAS